MSKSFTFASLLGRSKPRAEDADPEKNPDDVDEAKRAEWAKKAESDDDRKQGDDESDDDYAKRMRVMDKEEDDVDAEGEDPDDDGDGDKKDAKASVKRERARCALIVAHGITHDCVRQAGSLAFDTNLSAKEAVSIMKASRLDAGAQKPARRASLSERMAQTPVPVIGADGGEEPQSGSMGLSARMVAAAAKARGQA